MFRNIRPFLASIKMQIMNLLHNNLMMFVIYVQPIMYAGLMYLMFKESDIDNFVSYIVLGTGMMNLWSAIVFSAAGAIQHERYMGTLEYLNAVPTSFQIIILGKVVGSVIVGLASSGIGYLFILLLSRQTLDIKHGVWFGIIVLLVILSYIAISMMIAALYASFRQARDLLNATEFPVFILCGLMFPIEMLPAWSTPLSFILSPTWGVKLLRMCIGGIKNATIFYIDLIFLIGLTLLYFIASVFLYKKMVVKFRETGSLGVV